MTKRRRLALLVLDILMLLGGVAAVLLFIAFTMLLHETAGWPHIPSAHEVRATTETSKLRGMAENAYEDLRAFTDVVALFRWYFLAFGSLLFLGGIIHFCLTPWKLKELAQPSQKAC